MGMQSVGARGGGFPKLVAADSVTMEAGAIQVLLKSVRFFRSFTDSASSIRVSINVVSGTGTIVLKIDGVEKTSASAAPGKIDLLAPVPSAGTSILVEIFGTSAIIDLTEVHLV